MTIKAVVTVLALLLAGLGVAYADAKCEKHPKKEWIKKSDARAKVQEQGYKIDKFEIEGNCYELNGYTKDGKKVEVNFDPKTLEVVKVKEKK